MATKKESPVMDWESAADSSTPTVFYRTLNVEGLKILYREDGPRDAPAAHRQNRNVRKFLTSPHNLSVVDPAGD